MMVSDITEIDLLKRNENPLPSFRFRRASSRLSSVCSDEPEPIRILGQATLCFEKSGSSFLGVIHGVDSDYSIHGSRRTNIDMNESTSESCSSPESSSDEDDSTPPSLYDIRIKDHDDPTLHYLKGIHIRTGKDCKFKCGNVSFKSENSYRGHKAQLVAQSCLGRGSDSGKMIVFTGQIDITIFDSRPQPRPWVL